VTRAVTRDTPPPHHLAVAVKGARRAGSVFRICRFLSWHTASRSSYAFVWPNPRLSLRP